MRYNLVPISVPAADTIVLGGNMKRKALIIQVNSATLVTFNFGRSTNNAGSGYGFSHANNISPLRLNREDYGDAITEEIHAQSASGTVAATILEVIET